MSLGKKITFLFFGLAVLMVYSVATFDYKAVGAGTKSSESELFDTKVIIEYTTQLRDKAIALKEELLKKVGMKTQEEIIIEQSVNLEELKQDEETVVNKLTTEESNIIDSNNSNEDSSTKVTDIITNYGQNEVKNTKNIDVSIDKKQEVLKNVESIEEKSENPDKIIENNELSNSIQTPKQIQSKIDEILASNKISFKRRSVKITKDSLISVQKVAEILKENKDLKVEIAGHTDSRGKASLNKRISQDRANSVKKALVKLGIDKNRLKAVGYGEQFPVAKDDKDGLSEINRRVEINIEGVKK